jgi:hypothetical protein
VSYSLSPFGAIGRDVRRKRPPPLLILGCPRSFTSIVGAMLGQHPQMYALPETHLFWEQTLGGWLKRAARAPWPMSDGLLRAVAELYFDGQDKSTVRLAHSWLDQRSNLTTDSPSDLRQLSWSTLYSPPAPSQGIL